MKKQFIRILFLALCSAVCVFCLSACSLFDGSSASDHHHEYQTQEVPATCTDGGYTLFECACGDKFQINSNPLGHEFVTYNADNNATCETNATETATCIHENCQAQDVREIKDSALGHDFTDYFYDSEPTNGVYKKTAQCNHDNCQETDSIPVHPNSILIVTQIQEAEYLEILYEETQNLPVNVVDISDTDSLPNTTAQLCEYKQVALVNIANSDLPENFDDILHTYVYECGGSLFTVGGNDENGEAHAYNRADLFGTLYQQMLPVQAINYTPPVGVMLLIDNSGSMGITLLELAKDGAMASLHALTERDYCGVMPLSGDFTENVSIHPVTQQSKIIETIDNIETGGGTVFAPAIEKAGQALRSLTNVVKRHIILVTDGLPADSFEEYGAIIKNNYETAGITLSIVGIDVDNSANINLQKAVELGDGRYYSVTDTSTLPALMREELNVPEIKEIFYETFTPKIHTDSSVVNGISQEDMPTLDGFYGTKIKENATMILSGNYGVPIYAEWDYGNGRVGSFMCDLNGTWSADFIQSETGRQVLIQMLKSLMRI